MKTWFTTLICGAALALGSGLFFFAGCAHAPAITDGLENISLDCAKDVQPDILPAIESALATKDWQAQLEVLAGKTAVCVVSKGVAFVVDELTNGHASRDVNASAKVARGTQWLQAHPVQ